MINNLKRIKYSNAIILGDLFVILTILVHSLIFAHIIPRNWVSGGLVTSIEIQNQISLINLGVISLDFLFIQCANHSRDSNTVRLVAMTFSIVWFVGLLMQLLGTPFEKLVMTIVLLIGLISHFRLTIKD